MFFVRETLQFRKKALTNSLILCFAYCSYWTVAGILFVILFSEDSDDDKPHLFGAFAVIIGALGLVDGIVWIIFQGFPWCVKSPKAPWCVKPPKASVVR